jgi:hypothetical protein
MFNFLKGLFPKESTDDRVKLIGEVTIALKRKGEDEFQVIEHLKNLIVRVGKASIAARINGASAVNAYSYLALGTGTGATAAANTALGTEITLSGLARASAAVSRVSTTVSNDTAQIVHTWTATGTFAITEEGVFNASSNGTMLARRQFAAINVVNGDQLQVTHKITVA